MSERKRWLGWRSISAALVAAAALASMSGSVLAQTPAPVLPGADSTAQGTGSATFAPNSTMVVITLTSAHSSATYQVDSCFVADASGTLNCLTGGPNSFFTTDENGSGGGMLMLRMVDLLIAIRIQNTGDATDNYIAFVPTGPPPVTPVNMPLLNPSALVPVLNNGTLPVVYADPTTGMTVVLAAMPIPIAGSTSSILVVTSTQAPGACPLGGTGLFPLPASSTPQAAGGQPVYVSCP